MMRLRWIEPRFAASSHALACANCMPASYDAFTCSTKRSRSRFSPAPVRPAVRDSAAPHCHAAMVPGPASPIPARTHPPGVSDSAAMGLHVTRRAPHYHAAAAARLASTGPAQDTSIRPSCHCPPSGRPA